MEKALLIFSILFGIIGLQVSTQAVDYENFVFKGTECYTERQDEEQAEAAYESARQKDMKPHSKAKNLTVQDGIRRVTRHRKNDATTPTNRRGFGCCGTGRS